MNCCSIFIGIVLPLVCCGNQFELSYKNQSDSVLGHKREVGTIAAAFLTFSPILLSVWDVISKEVTLSIEITNDIAELHSMELQNPCWYLPTGVVTGLPPPVIIQGDSVSMEFARYPGKQNPFGTEGILVYHMVSGSVVKGIFAIRWKVSQLFDKIELGAKIEARQNEVDKNTLDTWYGNMQSSLQKASGQNGYQMKESGFGPFMTYAVGTQKTLAVKVVIDFNDEFGKQIRSFSDPPFQAVL